uniref:PDZ domain-containing protein n=1 Tax=Naja naja TaxID=35670 RepID=A0A8C6Y630_NAJNA
MNLCQMEKEDEDKEQTKVPGAQLREPISPIYSQQLVFQDGIKVPMNRPVNHLCQTKQHTKQVATTNNLMNLIPAPPATGKVHSSPMSYRRAVLTGSHKLIKQNPGHINKTNELSVSAAYSDFQDVGVSGLEEHNGQQNPEIFSKHLALSSNNHNNISTKPEPQTIITGRDEQLEESEKMGKNQVGPSSSTCGVPPVAPNIISSTAINLSLITEETNFTISTQSINREAPVADMQKIKPGQANIIQCKHLEVYPQPKKQQSSKKDVSSASGLKKFFTTLSQSTKQQLGRFRCYSMEQISMLESGAAKPNLETGPDTICSPKMKKVPSLQSLQRVSPFCQPRKASSVQNLHSFLGKNNRSNVYLVGESKDEEASSNRDTRTQPRRSLSVEDIGSPNLARTVGRVVAVFPDGTSQLELLRSQQGNFGFRVSSGNGRPDTGIYVQEMADTSTAKLYAGLLEVGDEILEVNGAKVAGLGLARINELLLWAETLSLRVLKQRPVRQ